MGFFDRHGWWRTLLLAAALAVGAVCWLGCGGDDNPADNNGGNNSGNNSGNNNGNNNNGGGDGSSETVSLGGLKWMKKNLNVETAESWCYGEGGQAYDYDKGEYVTLTPSQIQTNCNTYGRLYTWESAKAACQSVGMRLPTRDDWDNLAESVGGTKTSDYGTWHDWLGAGKKLKAASGWNDYNGQSGNGTDDFQFSALSGGFRTSADDFLLAGDLGFWWTATEGVIDYIVNVIAYVRRMDYNNDGVFEGSGDKSDGFSARCVKD